MSDNTNKEQYYKDLYEREREKNEKLAFQLADAQREIQDFDGANVLYTDVFAHGDVRDGYYGEGVCYDKWQSPGWTWYFVQSAGAVCGCRHDT